MHIVRKLVTRAKQNPEYVVIDRQEAQEFADHVIGRSVRKSDSNLPQGFKPLAIYGRQAVNEVREPWLVLWADDGPVVKLPGE